MSVMLMKVLWFPVDASTGVNITDAIDMNIGRGLDIKNNTVTINLKNQAVEFLSDGTIRYTYVDDTGDVRFKENDQVKIYLRYTDDMVDVESSAWDSTTLTEPGSDYLKGVYYIQDVDSKRDNKSQTIRIKCADKAYILFNRLLAKNFPKSDGETAPTMIQRVIRFSSENEDGIYTANGATYDVDAKLVSEGGFIQDTRKATKEDGSVNPDTTFPTISLAKVWKPVYEWVNELSQIENTNTTSELADVLVYGRPFIMWVDENNKFHWVETDETITSSHNITVGTTSGILNHNVSKSVFDVTNFVVGRGGEDFYGNGTLNYYVDPTTNVKSLKMRVIAMIDIADKLIRREINAGNLVANTSGAFTYSGNRYNSSGYPLTPEWLSTTVADNSGYNTALRTKIIDDIKARSQDYVQKLSSARYKGSLERKGFNSTMGSLLTLNDSTVGINNENIRLMEVREQITKEGWFSNWSLEQDPEAIIEVS